MKDRETNVPRKHLQETVNNFRKFNAKRRLKDSILASLLSAKWDYDEKDGLSTKEEDSLMSICTYDSGIQKHCFQIDNFFSFIKAIVTVLDSLEEMEYLTDGCDEHRHIGDQLYNEKKLVSLLNVGYMCRRAKKTNSISFAFFTSKRFTI